MVGIDKDALSIHRTDAVGITIRGQPYVRVVGLDGSYQSVQVLGNGLRVDAAKAGVHLAPYVIHVTARASQHL